MKKLLVIPAAILTLSTTAPALAQSNTQLYGLMDIGYAVSNGGIFEGANGRNGKFQQWGNGTLVSRWGIKGSEDLNNGLRVIYQLEAPIDPENGDSKGFSRIALVGVSGNFGTITLGRQQTIFDEVLGDLTPSGDPNLTSANVNTMVASGQRVNRFNSMLKYVSPDFSGFGFRATYVSNNDDAGSGVGNLGDKNIYSLAATYNWNKLSLGAAYESKPNSGAGVSASWGIAATYDFDLFLLGAGYIDNHYKDDGKGFYVGVSVPVDAFTFAVQVAYNTDARAGNDRVKPFAWELTSNYKLSNRTSLYMTYGGLNNDAKLFAHAERKYSFAFGIVHRF